MMVSLTLCGLSRVKSQNAEAQMNANAAESAVIKVSLTVIGGILGMSRPATPPRLSLSSHPFDIRPMQSLIEGWPSETDGRRRHGKTKLDGKGRRGNGVPDAGGLWWHQQLHHRSGS